jgi:hypothetical protein
MADRRGVALRLLRLLLLLFVLHLLQGRLDLLVLVPDVDGNGRVASVSLPFHFYGQEPVLNAALNQDLAIKGMIVHICHALHLTYFVDELLLRELVVDLFGDHLIKALVVG